LVGFSTIFANSVVANFSPPCIYLTDCSLRLHTGCRFRHVV